jgi:hypothetical protein
VVPELERLIRLHPGIPSLKNYLSSIYRIAGRERQARKVEEQTRQAHPDYLSAGWPRSMI